MNYKPVTAIALSHVFALIRLNQNLLINLAAILLPKISALFKKKKLKKYKKKKTNIKERLY